ncbi:MAG: hypothetical protein HKN13_11455 [Rhodothermales bacterium]|nr:hypothetical protein [Rhodothermales bacterium]
MKTASARILVLAALLIGVASISQAHAQSRVYEKDILGEWKLTLDLADQGDNTFERMVLGAIDGLIDGIDIHFIFEPDNKMMVTVNAMGDDDESEESEWRINKEGQLMISETDNFESDDVWLMKDGRLYSYEIENGELVEEEGVFLERVD